MLSIGIVFGRVESFLAAPGDFSRPGVYARVDNRLPTESPINGASSITSIANPGPMDGTGLEKIG